MCDCCQHFYHIACVGSDEITLSSINTYKCNSCAVKGVDELMYEEIEIQINLCKDNSGSND